MSMEELVTSALVSSPQVDFWRQKSVFLTSKQDENGPNMKGTSLLQSELDASFLDEGVD